MKHSTLILLFFSLLTFIGCYTVEDASDVNQDRIKANYCTIFNGTHQTTKSVISFRFGQTPLRVSNPMYYTNQRLHEKEDLIFGLHYSRQHNGIKNGDYEWTDENGSTYSNSVRAYPFSLLQSITELKKYTYYNLNWEGEEIPYEAGSFTISVNSLEDHTTVTFTTGELIEIHSDDLTSLPLGRAIVTISRHHKEPVEQRTPAGGKSTVIFEREYEILIID